MQKKLIALAVASLITAPALAQSNVSIYGIVDMGYSWTGKNVNSGIGSRVGLDSGLQSTSRIGFTGTEDLGNGLKASFVLERGLSADTGEDHGGWDRQAFLALSGNFGTAAFGRQWTPEDTFITTYDPFDIMVVGASWNVWKYDDQLQNLAAYVSPDWNGFSFAAGYTHSGGWDESIDNDGDIRVFAIAPQYTVGNFSVGLNYHQAKWKESGNALDGEKVKVIDLFGSYDFGVAKLSAGYGVRKASEHDFLQYFNEGEDTKQWLVAVSAPIGANGRLMASYTHRKTDAYNTGDDDAKARQWAIGYTYDLSKRTNLYASYVTIKNNSAGKESLRAGGNMGSGLGINPSDGYQRGMTVGIRHLF